MNDSVLRIDPDLSLCWEDPFTLRVGFDRVHARIDDPPARVQRLISALRSGVHENQLRSVSQRAGATPQEEQQTLAALEPVIVRTPQPVNSALGTPQTRRNGHRSAHCPTQLQSTPTAPRSPVVGHAATSGEVSSTGYLRILMSDNGTSMTSLRAALNASDACMVDASRASEQPADLVVVVERFYEPLERTQRWHAAGIPHLIIRFTDEAVTVGPLVASADGPCLTCLAKFGIEQDPALPAMSAQLVGKRPAAEGAASGEVAAAAALTQIRRWVSGDRSVHQTRFRFTVHRGLVSLVPGVEQLTPHPDCACATQSLCRVSPSFSVPTGQLQQ